MALQMGYSLMQEQRLKLVMTPELRQAIQILQYSATDLLQYIQQEMTENPVLEFDEKSVATNEVEELNGLKHLGKSAPYSPAAASTEKENPIERVAAGPASLADALEAQLCDYDLDAKERNICLYLIRNLDEKGYLDIDSISVCKRFQIGEDEYERCLAVLHSMEPDGVGARSLSECIEIQLLRKENPNRLAIEIARDHLPAVADGKLRRIAHKLGVDVLEVQAAIDEIKSCNPRPGSSYPATSPRYVYPDVVVERVDGEYQVVLNEKDMPRLTINPRYQKLLAQKELYGEEAAAYLKNWMQSALWLVKGIEQRRDTIYRVADAIVSKQRGFLDKGLDYLKPLTLKQIAEELNLHESTISRATQHKYMQTPRGLFSFRFFFPSGLSTENGEDLSAKTVKMKIKQLIDEEDKEKPLSDQKISNQLQLEGIRISRRTVAKYREEMGIAASSARKRYT
ncbi:RNA polymerase factor sigma-54 [Paenactinomyces guangxiensis]|uniref:RNA polymerase factor sigma-54 n=1 Tax=Paenactinomyces guangxiensis TaxID=1490290 RepID=A0A7W1WUD4_9BACL|nr:RNA polymerase factor sigma-54 [Paenactinomyces guangxiensis]MBA4496192.1 RNA polymerase factor sigma-54 [Paenactinomyces guangxiensis]MBH8593281.1 RNA polymerase factor sigma-54 [Paenactinomyces guangxiensis]